MRMNNKTMQIVVDEIYKQVSEPIIENNKVIIEGFVPKKTQYHKDCEKYNTLKEEIKELEKQCTALKNKYQNKTVNGYKFSYWDNPFNNIELKNYEVSQAPVKKYPSKDDIEKEIILAGNKDIPALIELIVNKLK